MNAFCSPDDLKKAVDKCISVLEEKEVKDRNISDRGLLERISELRGFLEEISNLCEKVSCVTELVKNLEESLPRMKGSYYIKYVGKLLDAVQLVKTRREEVGNILRSGLRKTGHDFLIGIEEYKGIYEKLLEEVVNAMVLYNALHIIQLAHHSSSNPISELRGSMGSRTPEEYFSNLVVGWFVEEVFYQLLESKGVDIKKEGVDAKRKILFNRQLGMGKADFSLRVSGKEVKLDLQRVGEGSIKLLGGRVRIEVPKHKFVSGNLLVFWVGEGLWKRKKHKSLENLLIFYPVPSQAPQERIELSEEKVEKLGKKWEEVLNISKDDFLDFLTDICRDSPGGIHHM